MKKLAHRPDIKNAESLGLVLQSFLVSFERSEYQHILDHYGIKDFDPDAWYPLKLILEIFQEVQSNMNSSQNLVSIGMAAVELMDIKSRFASLEVALQHLPQMEQELHRNNPGYFEVNQISPKCIEVIDRTVWPHDLEYGVIYGFAHAFGRSQVERVRVETDPKSGDEVGIYHITWN
jgi:hypothetical protein